MGDLVVGACTKVQMRDTSAQAFCLHGDARVRPIPQHHVTHGAGGVARGHLLLGLGRVRMSAHVCAWQSAHVWVIV